MALYMEGLRSRLWRSFEKCREDAKKGRYNKKSWDRLHSELNFLGLDLSVPEPLDEDDGDADETDLPLVERPRFTQGTPEKKMTRRAPKKAGLPEHLAPDVFDAGALVLGRPRFAKDVSAKEETLRTPNSVASPDQPSPCISGEDQMPSIKSLEDIFFTPTIASNTRPEAGNLLLSLKYQPGPQLMPAEARWRILKVLYSETLPGIGDEEYMKGWGEPETKERLQRMVDWLAGAKVHAETGLGFSLDESNERHKDLMWLKHQFYKNDFPWPDTGRS
jgi:hypothetical protein